MKCKDKFYLHKGQCFRQCPPSTAAQPGTRECQGKQHPPAPHIPAPLGCAQPCVVTVPVVPPLSPAETCELGPWSQWSTCTHEGQTRGCKWGVETRAREVLGAAREEGAACPELLETRKCRLRKHCPGGERRTHRLPPPQPGVSSAPLRSQP